MKPLHRERTVADVQKWASIVSDLADRLEETSPEKDAKAWAKQVRGVSAANDFGFRIFVNFINDRDQHHIDISWAREVLQNICEYQVATTNQTKSVWVSNHKAHAATRALYEAARLILQRVVDRMDKRMVEINQVLAACNEHIKLVGFPELASPIRRSYGTQQDNREDDSIRPAEESPDPEGTSNASQG